MEKKPDEIKALEKQLGIKLPLLEMDHIFSPAVGYHLDQGKIIGLSLCGTRLKDLQFLTQFGHLLALNLFGTSSKNISPLASLVGLKQLYLGNNQIQDLSPLQTLARSGLRFKWGFTGEGINIDDNPLQRPPLEIARQGHEAILAWFDAQDEVQRPLNEVKVMLVGAGGCGKTSLVKAIRKLDHDPDELQTHGIRIETWPFERDLTTVQVRLWDFGGQEIMHATHQFFMSRRSLYVLVLDGRKEQNTEDYWLKHIESFGGDSPVLVVINKLDENPGFDVDRRSLLRKYPGIVGFHRLSCRTGTGVADFCEALRQALARVDILSSSWPEPWFQVKTSLEHMSEPFIEYDQYRQICLRHQLTAENQQKTLLQYLNDLGVALHFPDLEWLNTQVLEPAWITGAVYKIINHPLLASGKGVLALNQLRTILPEFPSARYPFLIALMKKFELCFEQNKSLEVLVPDLLPVGEPELPERSGELLHFAINYHFLPRSILPRLMVNLHADIDGDLRWRSGAVFHHKQLQCHALVSADYEERRITLAVSGQQRRTYFAVILHQLRAIHADFQKIGIREKMRCTCSECREDENPYEHDYQYLLKASAGGSPQVDCQKTAKPVSLTDLLEGTFGSKINTEAEVMILLNEIKALVTDDDSAIALLNKVITLKPNFFGIGVDMNEVINRLRKRKK